MDEYIKREAVKNKKVYCEERHEYVVPVSEIDWQPKADVVEVVRCKDCIYFQPDFVLTSDGERRPYTKEEKENDFGYVNLEKGVNCGSRCERHGYWEVNSISVWFSENDYCSYGERKNDNA